METHIWLWKYTFLFMSGYGHDESAPTPNGLFATHFVGGLCVFHGLFATHSRYEYGILGWYAKPKPLRELRKKSLLTAP